MTGIRDYQDLLSEVSTVRRIASTDRYATVHRIYYDKETGEERIQCLMGPKDGTPPVDEPFYSAALPPENNYGGNRHQDKFHKGQTVIIRMIAGEASTSMASVTPAGPNDKHKAPDHHHREKVTGQFGGVRYAYDHTSNETWLAKNAKAEGGPKSPDDGALVLHRTGNKSNKQSPSGWWDGPPPDGKGTPKARHLSHVDPKAGKPPSLNSDRHQISFVENKTVHEDRGITASVPGGGATAMAGRSDGRMAAGLGGGSTSIIAILKGLIEHKITQGGEGGQGGGMGGGMGSLSDLSGMMNGLLSQMGGMASAGAGSTSLAGLTSQASELQQTAAAVNVGALSGLASQLTVIAQRLASGGDTDEGAHLASLASQLLSHTNSVPNIVSQIEALASQLSSASALDGVAGLVSQMQVLAQELSSVSTAASGVGSQIDALASQLNDKAEGDNASESTQSNSGDLSGMLGQLQGMLGGMGGMGGMLGGGGDMHKIFLDLMKGVKSSAFNGQHTTTWDQNGVTHSSGTKVASTAPTIPHNGRTMVNPVLAVNNLIQTGKLQMGSLGMASDARLKSEIAELAPVLGRVLKLKIKTFNKRELHYSENSGAASISNEPPRPSMGLIAQEAREIFPSLIEEDDSGFLHVHETKIGMLAVAALQEYVASTDARIAALEARLAALENADRHL